MHASWFDVDQPCDDEDEVSQLERDHQNWVNKYSILIRYEYIHQVMTTAFYFQLQMIKQKNVDLTPIGKTTSEVI